MINYSFNYMKVMLYATFIVMQVAGTISLSAQNNQQQGNSGIYEERITISHDGKQKTITIITDKDGNVEKRVLTGDTVDAYLRSLAPNLDTNDEVFNQPFSPNPWHNFNFITRPNDIMERMQKQMNLFNNGGIQGFGFPDDSNGFFFGFNNDTMIYKNKDMQFRDFFNDFEFGEPDFITSPGNKDFKNQYPGNNEPGNFTDKENIIYRMIVLEEYSDNSESLSKMGISGLQMLPDKEAGIFRLEFYNKLNKDISIDVSQADGTHIFGQTFPGNGQVSCIINISPETPGIWYIKITRGKKLLLRRLVIS